MSRIQMVHCDSPEFAESWRAVVAEEVARQDEWIHNLRIDGICAAKADDGWVKWDERTLELGFPYFNEGIQIGCLVALGTYDKNKIVKLTRKHRSGLTGRVWWSFEVVS